MCWPTPPPCAGSSDKPGYLPGYGVHARRHWCSRAGPVRHAAPGHRAPRSCRRTPVPALGGAGPLHPLPRSDLPMARLRLPAGVRYRPHRALPTRADPPVEHQAVLPNPSPVQDVLHRTRRLDRDTTARRHHRSGPRQADGPTPPHPPAPCSSPNSPSPPATLTLPSTGPPPDRNRGTGDAHPKTHPHPRPRLPGAMGTRPSTAPATPPTHHPSSSQALHRTLGR